MPQPVRPPVAFFFKQWGGTNKKKAGRVLEERTWDELPVAKQIPPAPNTVESTAPLAFCVLASFTNASFVVTNERIRTMASRM
jgi:hypothetical protein